jgi:ribosome-associated protein
MPPAQGPKKPAASVNVTVRLPITLGQFLKVADLVGSGGEGKLLIAEGLVTVNGQVDRRRGHKLAAGDVIQVRGKAATVAVADPTTLGSGAPPSRPIT